MYLCIIHNSHTGYTYTSIFLGIMDDFYLLLYTVLHFQISFNMFSFVSLVIQQIFLMYQL